MIKIIQSQATSQKQHLVFRRHAERCTSSLLEVCRSGAFRCVNATPGRRQISSWCCTAICKQLPNLFHTIKVPHSTVRKIIHGWKTFKTAANLPKKYTKLDSARATCQTSDLWNATPHLETFWRVDRGKTKYDAFATTTEENKKSCRWPKRLISIVNHCGCCHTTWTNCGQQVSAQRLCLPERNGLKAKAWSKPRRQNDPEHTSKTINTN